MELKGKILLINDDVLELSLTSLLFTLHGYKVLESRTNSLKKKYALSDSPDVIICDIKIVNHLGLEYIDHIRNNFMIPIPVIITSTLPEEEEINKIRSLSMIDYFPKPFLFEELLKKVKETTSVALN